MATLEWKCMNCNWVGTPLEIKVDEEDSHYCPACGDYDVFPQRYFLCLHCGFKAEQFEFFPELPADLDPEEDQEEQYLFNEPEHHDRPSDGEKCECWNWIQIR
ncbi:MAG: hypothetical protein ACOYUZ_05280 [Patescibacteria group bacterium]